MNKFSEISMELGWDQATLKIPSIQYATELKNKVVGEHSESAFRTVFQFHRFCQAAKTEQETAAMNIISAAFVKGSEIFNK